MGSDGVNNKFNNSDKMLVTIMAGFGLFIAYNLWSDKLVNAGFTLIQNIFNQ